MQVSKVPLLRGCIRKERAKRNTVGAVRLLRGRMNNGPHCSNSRGCGNHRQFNTNKWPSSGQADLHTVLPTLWIRAFLASFLKYENTEAKGALMNNSPKATRFCEWWI